MPRQIYQGRPGAAGVEVYASAQSRITITAGTVCNTTATPQTITAHIAPAGQDPATLGAEHLIFAGLRVPDSGAIGLPLLVAQTIERGGALYITTSADDALTVTMSGNEHP